MFWLRNKKNNFQTHYLIFECQDQITSNMRFKVNANKIDPDQPDLPDNTHYHGTCTCKISLIKSWSSLVRKCAIVVVFLNQHYVVDINLSRLSSACVSVISSNTLFCMHLSDDLSFFKIIWASTQDFGTYCIGEQERLRWACAYDIIHFSYVYTVLELRRAQSKN